MIFFLGGDSRGGQADRCGATRCKRDPDISLPPPPPSLACCCCWKTLLYLAAVSSTARATSPCPPLGTSA